MQPQSDKTLIDRFLEWWRGLWGNSGGSQGSLTSDDRRSIRGATDTAESIDPNDASRPGKAPVATAFGSAQDSPGDKQDDGGGSVEETGDADDLHGGATGASFDEFSTGGYTGEVTERDAVNAAADASAGGTADSAGSDDTDRLDFEDRPGAQSDAKSGKDDLGNLGSGAQGSPGADTGQKATRVERETSGVDLDPEQGYSPFATDSQSDPPPRDRVDAADSTAVSGTSAGDLGVSDAGDLDAGELGSLEELDGQSTEFDGDASVTMATDLISEESDSLADLGHEASDYTTSAAQDQGMRIVDEDDPGITMGQETESDFGAESPLDLGVDSGADIEADAADSLQDIEDEVTDYAVEGATAPGAGRPGDAIDSAALSDAEFDTPGLPDEFVGDAANLDLESSTGVESSPSTTTEDLGTSGSLPASEFGSPGRDDDDADYSERDGRVEFIGLFGTSDIDVTDLSYLDDSENRRFDFSEISSEASSADELDSTRAEPSESPSDVDDDSGAGPAGEIDTADGVESGSTGEFLADASGADSNDFDASGVSNEAGVPADMQVGESGAEAPSGTSPEDSSSGSVAVAPAQGGNSGRTRGDGSGNCPAGFPIKGNASSKVYHVPGIPSHRGTKAEWCFATEADAIAAGYRAPGGQRNRAAGGSSPAARASDMPVSSSDFAGDTRWEATPVTASGNEVASEADDIASLQRQSPDDIASEYADASPEGGEQVTASDEVLAALDSQQDVDSQLVTDDAAAEPGESLYAGAVRGDGTKQCPAGYPIKGNAGSMIYHAPGRASYVATIAEWCFATEDDAVNAGFRPPKR